MAFFIERVPRMGISLSLGIFLIAVDGKLFFKISNKSLIDLSFKTKRFDSAYKYLNKYLDIYPANLNMLFAMAGLQFKMGSIEDSLRTLDNILSIDPKHKYALEFQKSILTLSVN